VAETGRRRGKSIAARLTMANLRSLGFVGSLLALAATTASLRAGAQEPPRDAGPTPAWSSAATPRKPTTDPLLPVGIVTTSIAAVLGSLGAFTLGTGGDEELGRTLLIAGGSTGLCGVPMMIAGAGGVSERRESEERVLGGGILMGAGATAGGAGIGFLVGENGRNIGAGLLGGGAATALIGAILSGTGAGSDSPPIANKSPRPVAYESPRPVAYESPRPVAYESPRTIAYESPRAIAYESPRRGPRSVARAATGKVLTGLGVANLVGGGLGTAAGWENSNGYIIIATGPIMGTGVLLSAIGIPLWVTGDTIVDHDESDDAIEVTSVPSVAVGPTSVSMRWRF
jgi:hypothetical protein